MRSASSQSRTGLPPCRRCSSSAIAATIVFVTSIASAWSFDAATGRIVTRRASSVGRSISVSVSDRPIGPLGLSMPAGCACTYGHRRTGNVFRSQPSCIQSFSLALAASDWCDRRHFQARCKSLPGARCRVTPSDLSFLSIYLSMTLTPGNRDFAPLDVLTRFSTWWRRVRSID